MKPAPVARRIALLEMPDQEFLELWRGSSKSPRTQRLYERVSADFSADVGKPMRLVTYVDAHRYVERLRGRASTIRTYVYALRSMFSFAYKLQHIKTNPFLIVKPPKKNTHPSERVLPIESTWALIGAPRSQRHRVLLRTLYLSGARVSEISRLRLRDVREHENGGGILWLTRKGGTRDSVWIPADLLAQLRAITPPGSDPDAFVFRSQRGGQLTPGAMWRLVHRYAAKLGLDKQVGNVSPHWLRHSHASHAIARGAPTPLVQHTLGHQSLATTGIYVDAAEGDSSARYLV